MNPRLCASIMIKWMFHLLGFRKPEGNRSFVLSGSLGCLSFIKIKVKS